MKTHTLQDYKDALEGLAPRLKDLIIDRAIQAKDLDVTDLRALIDYAYPDYDVC